MFNENMGKEKKQMAMYFQQFSADKLPPEKGNKGYYEHLRHTNRIMIMFRLLQKEILTSYDYSEKGEMTRHIWEVLLLNFKEKGISEYRKTIKYDYK